MNKLFLVAVVGSIFVLPLNSDTLAASKKNKKPAGERTQVSQQQCVNYYTKKGMRWKRAAKRCRKNHNQIAE